LAQHRQSAGKEPETCRAAIDLSALLIGGKMLRRAGVERGVPIARRAQAMIVGADVVVTNKAEIDECSRNAERCKLPGERDAVGKLIACVAAEKDARHAGLQGRIGFRYGLRDPCVVLLGAFMTNCKTS
jgi:hypothetical protein